MNGMNSRQKGDQSTPFYQGKGSSNLPQLGLEFRHPNNQR